MVKIFSINVHFFFGLEKNRSRRAGRSQRTRHNVQRLKTDTAERTVRRIDFVDRQRPVYEESRRTRSSRYVIRFFPNLIVDSVRRLV